MANLRELFEERAGSRKFKARNRKYNEFELVYRGERRDGGESDFAIPFAGSYRPTNIDDSRAQDDDKIVVNQVRRVAAHFAGLFTRWPRLSCWAPGDDVEQAGHLEAYALSVFRRSGLEGRQPQQALWLALRGDAVYGIGWEPREHRGPKVLVRTFDPRFCYPEFDPDDFGGIRDMLIAYEVPRRWAYETYGVAVDPDSPCQLFQHWTEHRYEVAINDHSLSDFGTRHDLGFCPFRWVFGDPSGLMAQADVREVPRLQEVYNESLLLAIDAIRKQIDPAYYVTGGVKDVSPEPGVANALPEGASVGAWPVTSDPQTILGTMDHLEASIQSTTGVSPISQTGQARGSIVTGAAVRHQVEAIEQRTETRKVLLETAFSRIAEAVLEVTRQIYPQELLQFRSGGQQHEMQGDKIPERVEFQAQYGGFLGLDLNTRTMIAMTGLGHLWDEEYAIGSILDAPGISPQQMTQRIHDYQMAQAKLNAEAQAEAQQIAQQAQGGGQQGAAQALQGSPTTRRPQRPAPPRMQNLLRAAYAASQGGNGR